MKRVASVWLPRWPTDRLSRARRLAKTPPPPDLGHSPASEPLVLAAPEQGGMRITAVNRAAGDDGAAPGMMLGDARALIPALKVEKARPRVDIRALDKLAGWCGRYSPWTARDGVDGIWLDISGCAHLFGGEAALAKDVVGRLKGFGVSARVAIAETPGAASAVARFAGAGNHIVAPGDARAALADLPVAALRLDAGVVAGLTRLGLRRIGDLYDLPRAPLVRRFGTLVAKRLDQALGVEDEPISPDCPVVPYRVRLGFAEPVGRRRDIDAALDRLLDELTAMLERGNRGARRLELVFYRVDGGTSRLAIGTSRPMRDTAHLAHLFAEKLDRVEAGFGIEMAMLSALATDAMAPSQLSLHGVGRASGDESDQALGCLIDRLGNRLGHKNVGRFVARESHIPERAAVIVPAMAARAPAVDWRSGNGNGDGASQSPGGARPIRLFARPEPVEVVAEVPEGPPVFFRWRRAAYRVAAAQGPERIAPEWWRRGGQEARTRDYYRVEDIEGRRFWLYRDGLYRDGDGGGGQGREAGPDWYLHGIFA